MDAIAGICGPFEDAVTTVVTPAGQNRIGKIHTQLKAILQAVLNKMIDRNVISVVF